MKTRHQRGAPPTLHKQRGLVLFFALIALVVMSLAAVALVRSVDTNTMIAGNLAFKQAATNSADGGLEQAIAWLGTTNDASVSINVLTDASHPFNSDDAASGYYSSADPALHLTDGTGIQWTDADSKLVGEDAVGNEIRYIIQRMCRTANSTIKTGDCLFSQSKDPGNDLAILKAQEVCSSEGCPPPGQTPQLRITVRSAGPKNTVSYVQAFVY
jgi:type IV pilus assembly protein PilX